jgi:hypothetical protein
METENKLVTSRGGVIVGMEPSEDPELLAEIKKLVGEMSRVSGSRTH